jgi:hypothetical protein
LGARVAESTTLPVIGLGGAGHPDHVHAALDVYAAAAAANIWHYTEHSAAIVKAFAARRGAPVRRDLAFTYAEFDSLPNGRLARLPAEVLEERVFEMVGEETI